MRTLQEEPHHDEHSDDDGHEEHGHGELSVRDLKIILIFVMFIVTFAGVLPVRIPCIMESEAMLSYLNCFAAGMFLAIALIHMMPEAVEQHREWAEQKEMANPFPLPFCMMFVGYQLVLLVDRVIMHQFIGHHHHNDKNQCVMEPTTIKANAITVTPVAENLEDCDEHHHSDRCLKEHKQADNHKKPKTNQE